MGDRTAQERHLLHARQANIADEFPLTADIAGVLLARQPRSNPFRGHARPLRAPGACCDPLRTRARAHANDMNSQIAAASTGKGCVESLSPDARAPEPLFGREFRLRTL